MGMAVCVFGPGGGLGGGDNVVSLTVDAQICYENWQRRMEIFDSSGQVYNTEGSKNPQVS